VEAFPVVVADTKDAVVSHLGDGELIEVVQEDMHHTKRARRLIAYDREILPFFKRKKQRR